MDLPITYVCGPGGTFQIFQYGQYKEKMVFTVMTRDGHTYLGVAGPIPILQFALVQVQLQGNTETRDINFYVRIKRDEGRKKDFLLHVSCEEFNQEVFCSDNWIEIEVKRIKPDCRQTMKCDCGTIRLFKIEIQFMKRAMPCTSVVSNGLYGDTEFTDFQLRTADGSVAVHKNVLYMHSDRFKEMLRGEWKEKAEGPIDIDGMTVRTLEYLKDYMYLDTLPDFTEELELLLIIAVRYSMDKLKEDCIRKIIESIRPGRIDECINFACQNNIPELVTSLVFDVPDNQKILDRMATGLREMRENGFET